MNLKTKLLNITILGNGKHESSHPQPIIIKNIREKVVNARPQRLNSLDGRKRQRNLEQSQPWACNQAESQVIWREKTLIRSSQRLDGYDRRKIRKERLGWLND